MATFADTLNPTAFGLFDSESDFISDADSMVVFVKRMLGDDILGVELTKKQIWQCFERATLEWGNIVSQHQAKSLLTTYLGQPTGSNKSTTYPRRTAEFLIRQAEPYAVHANLGGSYIQVLGKLPLEQNRQDYDIHTELLNPSGSIIFDTQPAGSKQRLRIMEVFHFAPTTAYRFFDSTSAVNFLNNEFQFESFTPETIFYVLPVFEDILRAQQMNTSFRVRRSHYSYQIHGNGKLRIMPIPTKTPPGNLFIRVAFGQSASGTPDDPNAGAGDVDDTLSGVNSISNFPYDTIPYNSIKGIGRQTIRELTLAYAKELLGLIRGKIQGIPIAGETVTLNYEQLISQGREDVDKIKERLTTLLDETTYDKLLEKDAAKAENLLKQLRMVPMPNGGSISFG